MIFSHFWIIQMVTGRLQMCLDMRWLEQGDPACTVILLLPVLLLLAVDKCEPAETSKEEVGGAAFDVYTPCRLFMCNAMFVGLLTFYCCTTLFANRVSFINFAIFLLEESEVLPYLIRLN
ncbi:hypothetical protein ILYODFUR_030638 [Ilyodon furcidens]|uniref:Uncharacterized protein n=1 Tax=Ilyodon furcidens TaxID=33524 RepID=A0ABV0UKM3_9TELE